MTDRDFLAKQDASIHKGRFDNFLKKMIPHMVVARRYIAGTFVITAVAVGLGIDVVDRLEDNTAKTAANGQRSAEAICAIVTYAEETAGDARRRIPGGDIDPTRERAINNLENLGATMRGLVKCPPATLRPVPLPPPKR